MYYILLPTTDAAAQNQTVSTDVTSQMPISTLPANSVIHNNQVIQNNQVIHNNPMIQPNLQAVSPTPNEMGMPMIQNVRSLVPNNQVIQNNHVIQSNPMIQPNLQDAGPTPYGMGMPMIQNVRSLVPNNQVIQNNTVIRPKQNVGPTPNEMGIPMMQNVRNVMPNNQVIQNYPMIQSETVSPTPNKVGISMMQKVHNLIQQSLQDIGPFKNEIGNHIGPVVQTASGVPTISKVQSLPNRQPKKGPVKKQSTIWAVSPPTFSSFQPIAPKPAPGLVSHSPVQSLEMPMQISNLKQQNQLPSPNAAIRITSGLADAKPETSSITPANPVVPSFTPANQVALSFTPDKPEATSCTTAKSVATSSTKLRLLVSNTAVKQPVAPNSTVVELVPSSSGGNLVMPTSTAATTEDAYLSAINHELSTSTPKNEILSGTIITQIPSSSSDVVSQLAFNSSVGIPQVSSPDVADTSRSIAGRTLVISPLTPQDSNSYVEKPHASDPDVGDISRGPESKQPQIKIAPKSIELNTKTVVRKRSPGRRKQFEDEIKNMYKSTDIKSPKQQWTQKRINHVIKLIEAYNEAPKLKLPRTSSQYHYAHKYDVVLEDDKKILIQKGNDKGVPTVRVIPSEEYYDVISAIHLETNHGGRDKMLLALKTEYLIPTIVVKIFIKYCQVCQKKKLNKIKPVDIFANRGKVGLIDLQDTPDGQFKYILHYRDNLSKFLLLRPLTSNNIDEIALELLKILLEIGCPNILETNFARISTSTLIKKIQMAWPTCRLLNGKSRKEIGEGENKTTDENIIIALLSKWMSDNYTSNWSIGINFIQFQINSTYDKTIEETPFKKFRGKSPKNSLDILYSLPCAEIDKVEAEEQLEIVMDRLSKDQLEFSFEESENNSLENEDITDEKSDIATVEMQEESPVKSENEKPAFIDKSDDDGEQIDLSSSEEDFCIKKGGKQITTIITIDDEGTQAKRRKDYLSPSPGANSPFNLSHPINDKSIYDKAVLSLKESKIRR